MAKDSEQRSYSVDEMMEQLKKGERAKTRSEDAELVTRSDGSKAMRVRRRKRRKDQLASPKFRRRRYGLVTTIGFFVLLVAAGVSLLLVLARFNSRGYREDLEKSLGQSTGSQVGLADLSVNPIKSRVESVKFAWPAGSLPRSLKLSSLEARLKGSSFISSRLRGGELRARSGTMVLRPPEDTISPLVTKGEEFLDFGSYRCSQFDLHYGTETDDSVVRLRGSELTARPAEDGDGLRFVLSGGFARFGNWTELKVSTGLGEWNDGAFDLKSLYTKSPSSGEAVFKGVQPITAGSPSVFDVQLIRFPMGELLGMEALGRLIKGHVDAPSGSLTFDPRHVDSGQLDLSFSGTEISIEGFRFLGGLASILRKEHYARPEGGTITGTLKWDRDQLSIEDLKYEVRSHMMLTGQIVVRDQELSGTLRLGVPEVLMMKSLTEPRYSSFSLPRLGYCWTDLELSGTIEQPSDNFLRKLQAAPVKPVNQ